MSNIFTHVRAVLETSTARWYAIATAFPAEAFRRQPLEGEWSALECLQHLIDTDRYVFPVRIEALLAGENFPAFNPDAAGTQITADTLPKDLAAEFTKLRHANLTVLDKVKLTDLDKRAVHAELGPVTMSELLHEWAAHDLMHTVQAEQALMQPFIAGCSPWRDYFSLHIATGTASAAEQGQSE